MPEKPTQKNSPKGLTEPTIQSTEQAGQQESPQGLLKEVGSITAENATESKILREQEYAETLDKAVRAFTKVFGDKINSGLENQDLHNVVAMELKTSQYEELFARGAGIASEVYDKLLDVENSKYGYAGILVSAYLDALLSHSSETEILVTIDGNGRDGIGRYLTDGLTLQVNGDSGSGAGENMQGGILNIEGDAGSSAGQYMKGGTLNIEGDAGGHAGQSMKGGTINISGNTGNYAGFDMKGGTMNIVGNAGSDAGYSMKGGTLIFHGSVKSFDNTAFSTDNKGKIQLYDGEGNLVTIYDGSIEPSNKIKSNYKSATGIMNIEEVVKKFDISRRNGYKIVLTPK